MVAPTAIVYISFEIQDVNSWCRQLQVAQPNSSNSFTSILASLATDLVCLLCFLAFWRPIRERSKFLSTAFMAIDRPEDRPFTLTWLVTSFIATQAVITLVYYAGAAHWISPRVPQLMLIAFIVSCIGDALAEPIGVRFGDNKYKTRALFTDKTYVRTWEGSACVFLSAAVAVALLDAKLTGPEFALAMGMFPIALTIAEAKAPHTWDQPIIFIVWAACAMAFVPLAAMLA